MRRIKLKRLLKEWDPKHSEALHKRYDLKEGKYNKEILDVLGTMQSLIHKLKNDKSIDRSLTSKLHTKFSAIFNALHKLVD